MAWRIHQQVVRGLLDNQVKGKVTGTIWLAGRATPIQLALKGDPWRDWAGCVLRFKQENPRIGNLSGLSSKQIGVCGDMTAARKVRIAPEPVREWLEQGSPGIDSLPWGNSVYFEWFSESNGRVVIESTGFVVDISERAWRMTQEEETIQRRRNAEEMQQFMLRLQVAVEKAAVRKTSSGQEQDCDGTRSDARDA